MSHTIARIFLYICIAAIVVICFPVIMEFVGAVLISILQVIAGILLFALVMNILIGIMKLMGVTVKKSGGFRNDGSYQAQWKFA